MKSIKIGILKENSLKNIQTVVLTPDSIMKILELHPNLKFEIERGAKRCFTDSEYEKIGVKLVDSVNSCDLIMGINPIEVKDLKQNSTYFFINKLPYSIDEFEILKQKNISFIENDRNILAEITATLGTYQALRAFGIKFELFKLPNPNTFNDIETLLQYAKRPVFPPIKIAIFGTDSHLFGIKKMLKTVKIKEIENQNFCSKNYSQPVFTVINSSNEHSIESIINNSEILILANPNDENKSLIITNEHLKQSNSKIKVIADLCPENKGKLTCTVRSTTLEESFFGYLSSKNKECHINHPAAIVVTAVSELALQLPSLTSKIIAEYCSSNGILNKFQ